ncbi:uncharacterized protein LOC134683993 [Mytilus trossulus]|uniref:uncharacterized protein LOC134683993 n=1 Tax=Mytilus trossulus TaxID=6551 RepID=UPI0030064719
MFLSHIFKLFIVVFSITEIIMDSAHINTTVGDSVILYCNNTPGNSFLQWLRLNPSKKVTEQIYTDGWAVNLDIPHHHRLNISSFPNSTTYDLKIVNVTNNDSGEYRCITFSGNMAISFDVKLNVQEERIPPGSTLPNQYETETKSKHPRTENGEQYFDKTTVFIDFHKNTTESITHLNETKSDSDFLSNGIYWVAGMTGSGIVVFFTVFLSYIYLKKLNAILKKANQGHTMSIEYREEQTNNIENDNIEIYETREHVRDNTHARSVTRIGRRTINNEVYEIVQQHEPSPNIQTDHLTQDDENRSYQTVSADWSNDDHIYKELAGGQC